MIVMMMKIMKMNHLWVEVSLMSQSTNYTKNIKEDLKNSEVVKECIMKCRKTFIKCIRHNNEKSNGEILEFKSYLGDSIKPGDIYLGYDLNSINLDSENSLFLDENKNKLPDVILVRKKPIIDIKGKKLERLKLSNENKKNKKKQSENEDEDEDEDIKGFIEEIYEEKELKNNFINENDLKEEENNEKKEEPKKENEPKE